VPAGIRAAPDGVGAWVDPVDETAGAEPDHPAVAGAGEADGPGEPAGGHDTVGGHGLAGDSGAGSGAVAVGSAGSSAGHGAAS
jgi:hypothetical protein